MILSIRSINYAYLEVHAIDYKHKKEKEGTHYGTGMSVSAMNEGLQFIV